MGSRCTKSVSVASTVSIGERISPAQALHADLADSLDFQVTAIAPFQATSPKGLSLRVGEVLTIAHADPCSDGMLYGCNETGKRGYFPSTAVGVFTAVEGRNLTVATGSEELGCVVCMLPMIHCHRLEPCHHTLCVNCAPLVSSCPHCRARIDSHAPDHATTCAAIAAARYECDLCQTVLRNAFAAISHECPAALLRDEQARRDALDKECDQQWVQIVEDFDAPFRALRLRWLMVINDEGAARRGLEHAAYFCCEYVAAEFRARRDHLKAIALANEAARRVVMGDEAVMRDDLEQSASWLRTTMFHEFIYGRNKLRRMEPLPALRTATLALMGQEAAARGRLETDASWRRQELVEGFTAHGDEALAVASAVEAERRSVLEDETTMRCVLENGALWWRSQRMQKFRDECAHLEWMHRKR